MNNPSIILAYENRDESYFRLPVEVLANKINGSNTCEIFSCCSWTFKIVQSSENSRPPPEENEFNNCCRSRKTRKGIGEKKTTTAERL